MASLNIAVATVYAYSENFNFPPKLRTWTTPARLEETRPSGLHKLLLVSFGSKSDFAFSECNYLVPTSDSSTVWLRCDLHASIYLDLSKLTTNICMLFRMV
jgi:hypothetical protein